MKRPNTPAARHAYTLVEILTATVLMSIIMVFVTVIFANVAETIGESRATLEMNQRLRSTSAILKQDLENVTAVMNPPLHPSSNQGYFQYVEGPIGPVIHPSSVAVNNERLGETNGTVALDIDTTLGDIDDILIFTVKTKGQPYVGLIDGQPAVSDTAEIAWFVRGRTLYRRVLLVKPEADVRAQSRFGFYSRNDLSVHKTWDSGSVTTGGLAQQRPVLKANSLADLTTPTNRFAHNPDPRAFTAANPTPTSATVAAKADSVRYMTEGKVFPYFLHPWLGAPVPGSTRWVPGLGLPILAECSTPYSAPYPTTHTPWTAGDFVPSENAFSYNVNNPSVIQMPPLPAPVEPNQPFDPWTNGAEHPWSNVDPISGAMAAYRTSATRVGDDVIMTNVLGFDVKAWDPNAPILAVGPTGGTKPVVIVQPGDPGYIAQVRRLQAGSTSATALGAYADLNYMAKVPRITSSGSLIYPDNAAGSLPMPVFARQGNGRSLAYGTQWAFAMGEEPYPPSYVYGKQPYEYFPAVYDTWSVEYEYNHHTINFVSDNPNNGSRVSLEVGNEDRSASDTTFDEGTNGLDDVVTDLQGRPLDINGNTIPPSSGPPLYQSGIDDAEERETLPPYNVPLQGIQIRLRVFEPASRQVREVTIVQKFRTK